MGQRAAAMAAATQKKKPAKSKWMDSSDENEDSDETDYSMMQSRDLDAPKAAAQAQPPPA